MLIYFSQLFIKGLPPTITIEAVRELFSEHGSVKDVKFRNSYPGQAWIVSSLVSGWGY